MPKRSGQDADLDSGPASSKRTQVLELIVPMRAYPSDPDGFEFSNYGGLRTPNVEEEPEDENDEDGEDENEEYEKQPTEEIEDDMVVWRGQRLVLPGSRGRIPDLRGPRDEGRSRAWIGSPEQARAREERESLARTVERLQDFEMLSQAFENARQAVLSRQR